MTTIPANSRTSPASAEPPALAGQGLFGKTPALAGQTFAYIVSAGAISENPRARGANPHNQIKIIIHHRQAVSTQAWKELPERSSRPHKPAIHGTNSPSRTRFPVRPNVSTPGRQNGVRGQIHASNSTPHLTPKNVQQGRRQKHNRPRQSTAINGISTSTATVMTKGLPMRNTPQGHNIASLTCTRWPPKSSGLRS